MHEEHGSGNSFLFRFERGHVLTAHRKSIAWITLLRRVARAWDGDGGWCHGGGVGRGEG